MSGWRKDSARRNTPMTSERVAELERMRRKITLEDVVDFCYSLWRKVKDLETLVNEQGSR